MQRGLTFMSMKTEPGKIQAFKVTAKIKGVTKAEYTFGSIKEAIMFQVGMNKKGLETNLERISI